METKPRSACHFTNREIGITLLDLLLVLFLTSILYLSASATFSAALTRQRVDKFNNELQQVIQLGRRLAVASASDYILCPSRDQMRCDRNRNWADGYILKVKNQNEDAEAMHIIAHYTQATTGLIVHKNSSINRLNINSEGLLENTRLSICKSDTNQAITHMVIFYSGRIRLDEKNSACF